MDVIKQLTELDYSTLIIGVAVVALVFRAVCEFGMWIAGTLGLETKTMRQHREEHELLITTAESLKSLQQKQEEDVKQSIRHDEIIKADLKVVSEKVDAIANTLDSMEKKNNTTEMKKLKEKLVGYYNKYKNIGEWSFVEKEVFWDLFEDYESRNGDGFVHTTIEPVMRELKVIDKE